MHRPRRHSRVSGAALSASVAYSRRAATRHTVIDISEGGLRLAGLDLPVGAKVRFEIEGADLRCNGRGHVVRRTDEGAAVAVDRWAQSPPEVRALVTAGLFAETSWRDLYVSSWP